MKKQLKVKDNLTGKTFEASESAWKESYKGTTLKGNKPRFSIVEGDEPAETDSSKPEQLPAGEVKKLKHSIETATNADEIKHLTEHPIKAVAKAALRKIGLLSSAPSPETEQPAAPEGGSTATGSDESSGEEATDNQKV